MSTSGTYNWLVTQQQIITQAMLDIGALGEGEVPSAQEYTDCNFKLNNLVKQWMGKQDFAPGLKMWTRQRADLFLGNTKHQYQLGPSGDNWAASVTGGGIGQTHNSTTLASPAVINATSLSVASGTNINIGDYIGIVVNLSTGPDLYWTTVSNVSGATVTIPATGLSAAASLGAYVFNYTVKQQRPLDWTTCVLRDVYGNDIPITRMTLEDYQNLPAKVNPNNISDPSSIYYESQLTNGQLYIDVYGAQDVTKKLHIVFMIPVQDFDNLTDNPFYPQQWYRALCWGLGKDITGMFDCEWTTDMETNWGDSLSMAREADAETTSMYFQPGNE